MCRSQLSLHTDRARPAAPSPHLPALQPNFLFTTTAVSNDAYYTGGNLWGMDGDTVSPKNSFGSQAAEAWAAGYTGSADVWVGIIDEGVMRAHEDLAPNMGVNPGEIAGNGIDDDGNGARVLVARTGFLRTPHGTAGGCLPHQPQLTPSARNYPILAGFADDVNGWDFNSNDKEPFKSASDDHGASE